KNGFELLKELPEAPKVIFVSAYDEYAIRAFDVNALDYLLKPVQVDRLKNAINKATTGEEQKNETPASTLPLTEDDQVFVKDGEKCWFVKLSEVRLFESEGNYVRVFFDGN